MFDLDYLTSELTETQQEIEQSKKKRYELICSIKNRLAFLENEETELLDKIDRITTRFRKRICYRRFFRTIISRYK